MHNKEHFIYLSGIPIKTINCTMGMDIDWNKIQETIDQAEEQEFGHLFKEAEMIINHPDCWA